MISIDFHCFSVKATSFSCNQSSLGTWLRTKRQFLGGECWSPRKAGDLDGKMELSESHGDFSDSKQFKYFKKLIGGFSTRRTRFLLASTKQIPVIWRGPLDPLSRRAQQNPIGGFGSSLAKTLVHLPFIGDIWGDQPVLWLFSISVSIVAGHAGKPLHLSMTKSESLLLKPNKKHRRPHMLPP